MFIELVWKMQDKLNRIVFKKHENRILDHEKLSKTDYKRIDWDIISTEEIYDTIDLTNHLANRQKNAIAYCNAIIMEVCELMVALGFKWWSVDTKNWFNVKESAQYKHLVEEYIDILHFVISLGITLGLKPDQMIKAYEEKNKENIDRQARGY